MGKLIVEVSLKLWIQHQTCQGSQLALEKFPSHLIPLLQLLWFLKGLAPGFEF